MSDDKKLKAKKPKIKLPEGFDDEMEFLNEMRELFSADEAFDHDNREAGVQDLEFLVGDQWDQTVLTQRQLKRKPVLTINRLPAFVAQVLGSRYENEIDIHISPDHDGTKQVAQVREGLIRNMQKVSDAVLAFDNAYSGGVTCGVGNFKLDIDYDSDEVWYQSMMIKQIANHFAVLWDRLMTDPTGKDADHAFEVSVLSEEKFEKEYPWATPSNVITERMPAELYNSGWFDNGDVRVVNYWQMRTHKRVIALLKSGATVDITDTQDPNIMAKIAQDPRDGTPYMREVDRKYAQLYICSGIDVLEGPYDLPIDRVPIFRVPGWEIRIGDNVHRWGIIRHMKDPQRLHNYWRSIMAEKIMKSPKAVWAAADNAVSGHEKEWRESDKSDDNLLIWNSESGHKPERLPPVQVEDALIAQSQITAQDLKDVSNIHEANLGMPSNEVSGAAIKARVHVSDTGTALYLRNLKLAISECGRVANTLIPLVYDTPRMIKIIGPEAKELMQAINYISDPNSVDITSGKYNVTAIAGPSHDTKRLEQAENMMALATAMPQVLAVSADLIVEAQDWPGAEKIAGRIRRSLPPQLLAPDEVTPQIAKAAQAAGAAQQQAAQLEQQKAMAAFMKDQSSAALNFARANNYTEQANMLAPKLHNETLRTASEVASRQLNDSLNAISVAHG